jgi:hypothetical protein
LLVAALAAGAVFPGVALAAEDGSAAQTAPEPPPVVPDSVPVTPDPAPVAPDPAPAPQDAATPPDTASPPDSSAPAAAEPLAAEPGTQQLEAPPASTAVQQSARASNRQRESRDRKRQRAAPQPPAAKPTHVAIEPAAPQLAGMDWDDRSAQLKAAGLALLALVTLSGLFLVSVLPLARRRELQRR